MGRGRRRSHWFVFLGFIVLSLLVVEAYGEVIDPSFELPILGPWAPWNLLVEILAVTTVLGIAVLITIRQINHPRRAAIRSRFAGSHFGQAYFVEIVVLIEGLGVLLVRGLKVSAGYLHQPDWAAPVANSLGRILPSSDPWIQSVATVKVFSAMVWLIVIATNLTMGVAWHRFTVWFNIFHKREDDGSTALGALKPMMSGGAPLNLEEADPETDVFGAGKVEDFSWKGWLDFTTCTECGRCQSQCPAWNTAKPLSPKLVILSLRDHAYAKAPYLAAGGGKGMDGSEKLADDALATLTAKHPAAVAEAERPLIGTAEQGGVIDPEVLWDCTTCGACVEQCPVDIEHVDHIVDMRRYQVMIESEFPSELGGLFRNLENKGKPSGARTPQSGWPGPRTCRSRCRSFRVNWTRTTSTCSGWAVPGPSTTGPVVPSARSPNSCIPRRSASACWGLRRRAPGTRHGGPATSSFSRCSRVRMSRRSTPHSATGPGERSSPPVRTASTRSPTSTRTSVGSTRSCTTRSC